MPLRNWLLKLKKRSGIKETELEKFKKILYSHHGDILQKLTPVGEKGLVSVVLPVYNGEKYLDSAIQSVLSQTYPNLELIVVNDGSTDGSGDIIGRYGSSRIRYIPLDKNYGLPHALNVGFNAAHGELYTWISHDNIMLPNFIKELVGELRENENAAMVYANMRLIDENGNILRGKGWYEYPPLSGNVILPKILREYNDVPNNTIGAAFMYRACAAKFIGGYDENRFGIEDYDFFMRMNEIFTIIHSRKTDPQYLYRFHPQSLTARDAELKITENRPSLMKYDLNRRKSILSRVENGGTLDDIKTILDPEN